MASPVFPQVEVKIAYVAPPNPTGLELHIHVSTTVRISDDEGNFFYAPAMRRETFPVHDQKENIAPHLSSVMSRFMEAVYKMILAEVPDALVTTAKGERIYKPDTSTLTEQERMGVKAKPLMSHKAVLLDLGDRMEEVNEYLKMMRTTGVAMIDRSKREDTRIEHLTFKELSERYPLTPEEAFNLGRAQGEGK